MHYFSDLFDKVLYMFRTCPLSITRSIVTLYTHNRYLSFYFCWRLLADANRTVSEYEKHIIILLSFCYVMSQL
jgi:hypothetical protein